MTKHDFQKGDKVLIVAADYTRFEILAEDTVKSVSWLGRVRTESGQSWVSPNADRQYLVDADVHAFDRRLYKDTPYVRDMAAASKIDKQWQEKLERLVQIASMPHGAKAIFEALPEDLQKLAEE